MRADPQAVPPIGPKDVASGLFSLVNRRLIPPNVDLTPALERHPDRGSLPRHIGAIMASGSRRRALRGLQAPTLLIHGTRDPLVRPYGARVMARLIPDVRVEWVEEMGHGLPAWAWPQIIGAISAHTATAAVAMAG